MTRALLRSGTALRAVRNVALSLVLLASPGSAEPPSTELRGKIEALLGALEVEQAYAVHLRKVTQEIVRSNPDLVSFSDVISEYYDQQAGWQVLKDPLVQRFADTFSAEEIDGLLAFYTSPAGKHAVTTIPGLISQTLADALLKANANHGRLQEMVDEKIELMNMQ